VWLRISALVLVVAAVIGLSVYGTRRTHIAPPVDFVDDLTGPATPALVIPFNAYALTPEGLIRTQAATGRIFGNHRPMVKTASGEYLSRDFVFEVDVTIPAETQDLAYVGFGRGDPNPAYNDEPAGAFLFRIHNLPGLNRVDAAASLPSSERPTEAGAKVHAALTAIGQYVPASRTTFRIERAGSKVTLSMPATPGASHTFDMTALPHMFGAADGYLFFGNSAEGTIFSNVRVRPRG
jgi:hypothetical protein